MGERLLEPHDHVEHHISESSRSFTGDIVPWTTTIGSDVRVPFSSAGSLAPPRRLRPRAGAVSSPAVAGSGLLHPAGLAAFEGAPCYRELIDEEERAED